jgi:hypothetical protein
MKLRVKARSHLTLDRRSFLRAMETTGMLAAHPEATFERRTEVRKM